MIDPYLVLGIARDASAAEIKAAWRTAAKASHPDRHPDDPSAEARFLRAQAAWQTLSDPKSRQAYDEDLTPAEPVPEPPPATRRTAPRVVPWWVQDQAYQAPIRCVSCGQSCNPGAIRCDPCWAIFDDLYAEAEPRIAWGSAPPTTTWRPVDEWLTGIADLLRRSRRVCYSGEQERLERQFSGHGYWTRRGVMR